jgi:predicted small secreted protein
MTRIAKTLLVAAVFAAGCATSSGGGGDVHSTSPSTTSTSSGFLGKAEAFAGTAYDAAKQYLSQQPAKTDQTKTEAAQVGVSSASSQAQQQGTVLNTLEKQALLDYVKSKL